MFCQLEEQIVWLGYEKEFQTIIFFQWNIKLQTFKLLNCLNILKILIGSCSRICWKYLHNIRKVRQRHADELWWQFIWFGMEIEVRYRSMAALIAWFRVP